MKSPPVEDLLGELQQLPHRALVALAVRALWREQPLGEGNLLDEQQQASLACLLSADLFASGRDVDLGWFGFAYQVTKEAKDTRKISDIAEHLYLVTSRLVPAIGDVAAALSLLESIAAEFLGEAFLADLDWLRRWSEGKRAADGIVPADFFQRPLWLSDQGDWMPEPIEATFDLWGKGLAQRGNEWAVEHYLALVRGIDGGQWLEYLRFGRDWLEQFRDRVARAPEPEAKSAAEEALGEAAVAPEKGEASDSAALLLRSGTPEMQGERPSLKDHLGREALVETLTDLLSYAEQPPMTIALMGDWGSGKSSLVEQLKKRLPHVGDDDPKHVGKSRYLFADFNAWEYEQTDSMRAGLAQEVVKGLTNGIGRLEKWGLAVLHAHRTQGLNFWFSVLAFVVGLIGLAYGVTITGADEADDLGRQIAGTGFLGGGLFLLLKFWVTTKRFLDHPLAVDMKTYLQLPSYGKHLGEVPLIKKDLKALCETRLQGEHDRLLVVVDDLDRCHADAITDTFDAVRLVIDPQDLPKVAVIIAVDDRIAFRALARHYQSMQVVEPEEGRRRISRSKEEIARDYLSKIIQLPLRLEPPNEKGVRHFIAEALMPVERTEQPTEKPVLSQTPLPPITPAAQVLIEREHLDPTLIQGEGHEGAIRKVDVQRYLKSVRTHAGDMAQDYMRGEAKADAQSSPVMPDKLGDKEQAGRSAGAGQEAAELTDEQMERVMTFEPEEQKLFAELVAELRMNNPRQLIRLKNSYLVLKRFHYANQGAFPPESPGAEGMHMRRVEELMTALCWNEYLYQHGADQRHFDELIIWFWEDNPGRMESMIEHFDHLQSLLENDVETVPDMERESPVHYIGYRFSRLVHGKNIRDAALRKAQQEKMQQTYVRLMREVEMVVLPNAERGLILSLKEAEAVRQALEQGEAGDGEQPV